MYQEMKAKPNLALDQIKYEEVLKQWKKIQHKKSTDSTNTSAYLLEQILLQYLAIFTVVFNKCAEHGTFFKAAQHAKVICLPKEGIYTTVNQLEPISLLPNIGKWMEKIIHQRIVHWCDENNIYVHEQCGFTKGRRLQTRILSLVEDLRTTIAANNRPALVIFVDSLSAFDKLWYPALITNLNKIGLPPDLLKWICNWLQDRSITIVYGSAKS